MRFKTREACSRSVDTMPSEAHVGIEGHFMGYTRVNIDHLEIVSGRAIDDRDMNQLVSMFRLIAAPETLQPVLS